ncbi:MAG: type II toxin-antitoxin system RelE/ParE family toxin [Firmicutes bacterium]|nr:type II toxin-antitoxin system RelE/ParE family toxin [Bacillota bacterium]
MKKYTLEIADYAKTILDDIFEYNFNLTTTRAKKFVKDLKAKMMYLTTSPYMFKEDRPNIRLFHHKPYEFYYIIYEEKSQVMMVHIQHERMDKWDGKIKN